MGRAGNQQDGSQTEEDNEGIIACRGCLTNSAICYESSVVAIVLNCCDGWRVPRIGAMCSHPAVLCHMNREWLSQCCTALFLVFLPLWYVLHLKMQCVAISVGVILSRSVIAQRLMGCPHGMHKNWALLKNAW
uniref:Uncharacterized protein n=1 Tax=Pyxicephalus adspersus TaxID=30357 RepID=A0AAV3AL50_PYXAD|nr:TPA: hypothetical protein GDO54_005987 [Pyxicephalus adspersus]